MIKDLADVQHTLDCKLALVMKHSGTMAVAVIVDYSVNKCGNCLISSRSFFTVTDQNIHCTNVLSKLNIFNISTFLHLISLTCNKPIKTSFP